MEGISEQEREFLEKVERMSAQNRLAFQVLINNFDTIWEICETYELTPEERARLLIRADEWDDPVLFVFVNLEGQLNQ